MKGKKILLLKAIIEIMEKETDTNNPDLINHIKGLKAGIQILEKTNKENLPDILETINIARKIAEETYPELLEYYAGVYMVLKIGEQI